MKTEYADIDEQNMVNMFAIDIFRLVPLKR